MSDNDSTAFVTVTVSFKMTVGCWGGDCTLAQAKRQASEEALCHTRRLFEKSPDVAATVRVLGTEIKFKDEV